MAIKLPPNLCKVTLNFCSVCYNLSEIFSFRFLNMDFVIANSADPDEITHRVAFHLGLPCAIKYPIRGFWYTKGIQRLNISYIRVQKLQRIKFVIAFIVEGCHHFCQMMSGFREDSNSFLICQRSRPLLPYLEGPSLFYLFCSGSPRKYPCQILFNSDNWFQGRGVC